jgi:hypothetical protein
MYRPVLVFAVVVLSTGLASAETLKIRALPRHGISRQTFLTSGYAGRLALVAGRNIRSDEDARKSEDLRLLEDGACYQIVDAPLPESGVLYFAVSQAAMNTTFRNTFIAAQVLRYIRSRAPSNVAVSRNTVPKDRPAPWAEDDPKKTEVRGFDSDLLGRTPGEFAAAHKLQSDGEFNVTRVNDFFKDTRELSLPWHALLPRLEADGKSQGYYSSLDSSLAPVWSGLIDEHSGPGGGPYRVLARSYLISLKFGHRSGKPVVFHANRHDAQRVVVRIGTPSASDFPASQTVAFGFSWNGGCY